MPALRCPPGNQRRADASPRVAGVGRGLEATGYRRLRICRGRHPHATSFCRQVASRLAPALLCEESRWGARCEQHGRSCAASRRGEPPVRRGGIRLSGVQRFRPRGSRTHGVARRAKSIIRRRGGVRSRGPRAGVASHLALGALLFARPIPGLARGAQAVFRPCKGSDTRPLVGARRLNPA